MTMDSWALKIVYGIVALAVVSVGVLAVAYYCRKPTPAELYETWFAEHCKTCKVCAAEPTPDMSPLCSEAFKRLQDAMLEAFK